MGCRASIRIPGRGNTLTKEWLKSMNNQVVFQKLKGVLYEELKELGDEGTVEQRYVC